MYIMYKYIFYNLTTQQTNETTKSRFLYTVSNEMTDGHFEF